MNLDDEQEDRFANCAIRSGRQVVPVGVEHAGRDLHRRTGEHRYAVNEVCVSPGGEWNPRRLGDASAWDTEKASQLHLDRGEFAN